MSSTTNNLRKLAQLAGIAALAMAAIPLTSSTAESAQPPPCVHGSTTAAAFRREDLGKCGLFGREGTRGLNQLVTFDIYCPGRMTQEDANWAGRAIVSGAAVRGLGDEFKAIGLEMAFEDVPHVFQYACKIKDVSGLGTHMKLRVRGVRPERVKETADSCKIVNTAGSITKNATYDREYKCSTHFMANDSRNFIYDVADLLMERDPGTLPRNHKFCILASTNIQCAPCTTSDKLVVRTQVLEGDAPCNGVRTARRP